MFAIEFLAPVKKGLIEIPRKYREHLSNRVRVILLADDSKSSVKLIDQLIAHPVRIQGFRPLTREQIYRSLPELSALSSQE